MEITTRVYANDHGNYVWVAIDNSDYGYLWRDLKIHSSMAGHEYFKTLKEAEETIVKFKRKREGKEEGGMFTALIMRRGEDGKLVEKSNSGPWSAYVGQSKDEVVEKAVRHMEASNQRPGRFKGDYTVVVGEITQEVRTPVKWELVEIGQ